MSGLTDAERESLWGHASHAAYVVLTAVIAACVGLGELVERWGKR